MFLTDKESFNTVMKRRYRNILSAYPDPNVVSVFDFSPRVPCSFQPPRFRPVFTEHKTRDAKYVLTTFLPGYNKNNVKATVNVDKNRLEISGKTDNVDAFADFFGLNQNLPKDLDLESAKTTIYDGVFTFTCDYKQFTPTIERAFDLNIE